MDKNATHAHRIYDVLNWLHASTRPPTANMQLLNDVGEIQRLMRDNFKHLPDQIAQRQATELWMMQDVFPEVVSLIRPEYFHSALND
jgi:hypothetical protein